MIEIGWTAKVAIIMTGYDIAARDAYIEKFERETTSWKKKARRNSEFEKIPIVLRAMAVRGFFLTVSDVDLEKELSSYFVKNFPEATDPEVSAAIEYANQFWMMVYGY